VYQLSIIAITKESHYYKDMRSVLYIVMANIHTLDF